jgi:hypothetical protein
VVAVVAERFVRASEPTTCVPDAGVVVKATPADALGDRETLSVMRAVKIQRHTSSTVGRLCRQRPTGRGAAVIPESVPLDERPNDDTSRPISSLVPRGARVTEMGLGHYHFRGPADSMSPVALRHSLAGGLPFRLVVRLKYGRIPSMCQQKLPG